MLQVVVQAPPAPLPPPPPGPALDPNFVVTELAPVFGFVAFAIFALVALRWLVKSPVAEAIAERIRARTRDRFGDTREIESERVATLEAHVSSLQGQLSELAERVDFAERVLAERRERRLSAGQ